MLDYFPKYVAEVRDYAIDLSRWLRRGETVTGARAAASPGTLTIAAVTFTPSMVTVRCANGAGGQTRHTVVAQIETSTGQVKSVPFGIVSLDDGLPTGGLPALSVTGGLVTGPSIPDSDPAISVPDITVTAMIAAPPPFVFNALKTSGAAIVDAVTGDTVVLKSVNWAGAEADNYVPDGMWQVSYRDLIDQVAAWGFNCIRFPFSGDTFRQSAPTAGAINVAAKGKGTGAFDNLDFTTNRDQTSPIFKDVHGVFDTLIAYCAVKGIRVVLDHHRRATGSGGTDGAPTDASYTQDDWQATWTGLAQHYSAANGFANVCGADLHNEPYQLTWPDWIAACNGVIAAIQAVNADWLIFVEGVGAYDNVTTWWGGQLQGVATAQPTMAVAGKLVYSPHEYGQSVGAQAWLQTTAQTVASYPDNLAAVWYSFWGFIVKNGTAPLWIGEFGGKFGVDGSGAADATQVNATFEQQWVQALVAYVKAAGISFSYWDLNPNSGDTGGLLQDDWVTPQAAKLSLIAPLLTS